MTREQENILRDRMTEKLKSYFDEQGEDTGLIESNQFNFPAVAEDGAEFWYRITVSLPHYNDDEDEGYSLRETYQLKVADRKAKAVKKKKK